jgi:hypothetical protein
MKNWSTFEKMKASAAEVESYIWEIAKDAVTGVVLQHPGLLESDIDESEKWRYFDLSLRDLVNFKQQGIKLFSFGIEEISLNGIFRTDGEFRAYVYSHDRNQRKGEAIFPVLDTLLQSISEPSGFVRNNNNPPGYYYTKKLSPLAVDKLPDSQFLTEYFREPLVSVIEWYKKYSKQILAIEPKRFKRV